MRRDGPHSSLIIGVAAARAIPDVLQVKQLAQAIPRPSEEQAELARLRRELGTTQPHRLAPKPRWRSWEKRACRKSPSGWVLRPSA